MPGYCGVESEAGGAAAGVSGAGAVAGAGAGAAAAGGATGVRFAASSSISFLQK